MLPSLCVREIELERDPAFPSTFMEEHEHVFFSPKHTPKVTDMFVFPIRYIMTPKHFPA